MTQPYPGPDQDTSPWQPRSPLDELAALTGPLLPAVRQLARRLRELERIAFGGVR